MGALLVIGLVYCVVRVVRYQKAEQVRYRPTVERHHTQYPVSAHSVHIQRPVQPFAAAC